MKRFQIRWPDEWLRRTRLFRTDLLSYSGKDFIVSVSLYLISVGFCLVLRNFDPNNDTSYVSMIFLLDVFLTALLTDGFFFSLTIAVFAVLSVDYIFTPPFWEVSFTLAGFPLTFLVMMTICVATGIVTSRAKKVSEMEREAEREKIHSNLLRAVSHDIRTPLTGIVGATNVLLEQDDVLTPQQRRELYDLFLRLEFQKLIDKYHLRPHQETAEKPEVTAAVVPVRTEDQARTLLEEWRRADHVALYAAADLTAISVHWDTGESTAQTAELWSGGYQGDWQALLAALFAADIPKVSHNVKDLMRTLLDAGLPAEGFVFDTALAAYLLDATAGKYDLPRLFVSYFNQELEKPVHLEPDAFSPLGDQAAAWASLRSYGAAIEALYGVLLPRLREQGMEKLYFDVELPLCRVLADMERSGFLVDGGALARFGADLSDTIHRLEQRIYAAAGQQFNINSPKQLGKVLFEDLGLPHGKKTKSGWSTNADVLEKLKDHPLVADVLTYRQYAKLKSTYADGLLKVIDPDGRIRTSFQMTVTATGRLSSTEPNLQNIPTRTELGSKMREMFVAAPGHVLVDADYSQIELRLLAHISGDTAMQQAFLSGADFHTVTAARVFHVPQDQVTHQMRSRAKAVNFGIVYGISAFSLSQDIGVTVQEAKEYMDRYFATYTGVKQYMTDVVDKAREQGYVETLWHRRRALPELKSSNFNMRSFGERVALNMPIQGTAADIIKLAMVRVHSRLAAEGLAARLIMQVHDELIVECPEEEVPRVEALLQQEMQGVAELSVPLLAEAHTGRNWLAAKG